VTRLGNSAQRRTHYERQSTSPLLVSEPATDLGHLRITFVTAVKGSMAHFFTDDDGAPASSAEAVACDRALQERGVAFVAVSSLDLDGLAGEFSQPSPQSVFMEDSEYAQVVALV